MLYLNVSAQELTMDEMINMRRMTIEQIDSIIRSKDFVKTQQGQDTSFILIKYASLVRTDTALIQRSFTIGVKKDNQVELRYSVYQKQDASVLIGWLEKNGFKRTLSTMPGTDGQSIFEYVLYQRKNQAVGYEEKEYDSVDKKEKVYTFSVNTFDFP